MQLSLVPFQIARRLPPARLCASAPLSWPDLSGSRSHQEKSSEPGNESYGLRRMRWRGLAKAAVQVHLTALAYNLKRSLTIVAAG
ncbi:MAG: transposase [Rhizobiales bacterium]|nr:transposase [Hyphomicrobiales bacterium]